MTTQRFNYLFGQIQYNSQALKEIYDYYFPRIVLHINCYFRGKLDGRDIGHQFFVKLLEMRNKDYIKFPTSWINKVAENIALEQLQKNKKRKTAEQKAAVSEKTLDNLGDGAELLNCLDKRERQIVYLHFWEGYRLIEIAELLKMNYSTLKSAFKKAKTIIRKTIKKEKLL